MFKFLNRNLLALNFPPGYDDDKPALTTGMRATSRCWSNKAESLDLWITSWTTATYFFGLLACIWIVIGERNKPLLKHCILWSLSYSSLNYSVINLRFYKIHLRILPSFTHWQSVLLLYYYHQSFPHCILGVLCLSHPPVNTDNCIASELSSSGSYSTAIAILCG